MKQLLNLGCGSHYHDAWINMDIVKTGERVIVHDLRHGLPFPDQAFDVVYHSNILEHFSKAEAPKFLNECYRVLRPHGILRVAVPDLEQIVRLYLEALEKANAGEPDWKAHYEWILLELFDQTARNRPGGEMLAYIQRPNIPNEAFLIERCGEEIRCLRGQVHDNSSGTAASSTTRFFERVRQIRRYPHYVRELLYRILLGKDYQALQTGRFRLGGEVHQWMYDRFSLRVLLEQCGFKRIVQRTASESAIPDWLTYQLDTTREGMPYKPDSFYMEAFK